MPNSKLNGICMDQGVQGKCITNKATPTRTTPLSKEKGAALGGTRTHDTLQTLQLISSTPDKEGESCAGNNPLLLGVLGGVMCFIIVSQSLVIVFLLLWQKRASRLDSASPPLYP